MSDDGDRVRARRERIGIDKRRFAELAGVSRETLAAVEKGEGFRRTTLTKIERALEELEAENGIDISEPVPESEPAPADPTPAVVVISLGNGAVVVEGPVANIAELKAAAEDLMRRMGQSPDSPE